jgi:peptide/nickel transport system permease protein
LIVVFFLFQALPGDPVAMMAGQRTDISTREAISVDFGLDKPLSMQLVLYLKDLSPIAIYEDTPENQLKYDYSVLADLGENVLVTKTPYLRRSFQTNKRVDEIIIENLEGTLWLAFVAMLFATAVGIIFGMIAALKQNTFWDHTLVSLSVVGISAPSFVAAIIISIEYDWPAVGNRCYLWPAVADKKHYLTCHYFGYTSISYHNPAYPEFYARCVVTRLYSNSSC